MVEFDNSTIRQFLPVGRQATIDTLGNKALAGERLAENEEGKVRLLCCH